MNEPTKPIKPTPPADPEVHYSCNCKKAPEQYRDVPRVWVSRGNVDVNVFDFFRQHGIDHIDVSKLELNRGESGNFYFSIPGGFCQRNKNYFIEKQTHNSYLRDKNNYNEDKLKYDNEMAVYRQDMREYYSQMAKYHANQSMNYAEKANNAIQ